MKPETRENDETPKRADDIKLSGFGLALEASGRTVVMIVCAVAALAYGFWHEQNSRDGHVSIMSEQARTTADLAAEQRRTSGAIAVLTCVLTLNEQERVLFRRDGRYCGGYNASAVREQVTEEPKK